MSKTVAVTLNPKLDSRAQAEKDLFNSYLRKAAHLAEFLVLGICVAGFTVNLGGLLGGRYISLPILTVLGVAVGDEFIQNFTGRGSAVTDVVLDFLGALVGLALVALFCWLRSKMIRRK